MAFFRCLNGEPLENGDVVGPLDGLLFNEEVQNWDYATSYVCPGDPCAGNGPNPTPPPTPALTPPPTPNSNNPPPPTPPTVLSATTTRYWDCSGGACGCAYLPLGPGSDANSAHCHSNAMFAAPAGNEFGAAFYGAAAVSRFLWDGNTNSGDWMGEGCGKCWKVTGSSNIGPNIGASTTVVLKGTNVRHLMLHWLYPSNMTLLMSATFLFHRFALQAFATRTAKLTLTLQRQALTSWSTPGPTLAQLWNQVKSRASKAAADG